MPKDLSHDEIAQRLVQSEAINFGALGKFVTDIGPDLLVHDLGWHGVNFGRFNILACMMPAVDVASLVSSLRAAGQIANAIGLAGEEL